MPRTARLRLPGYPLHIVQRGHNRQPCFFEPTSYELYLGLLGEQAHRHGCSVHAYVLMTNHVHLLLTEREPSAVTALMRAINQRYVQAVNRRYRRSGSLWQGRFHSSIVDSERYLFACYRYVELNPVRAGLVAHPDEYPWSSYQHNAWGRPSLFLEPHGLYRDLGCTPDKARAAYRSLFENPLPETELDAVRAAVRASLPIGSDAFLQSLQSQLARPVTRGKRGRPWPLIPAAK